MANANDPVKVKLFKYEDIPPHNMIGSNPAITEMNDWLMDNAITKTRLISITHQAARAGNTKSITSFILVTYI